MEKYQFYVELGELCNYNQLNQKYHLDQKPEYDRFQKDTLYFIEEERRIVEFWNDKSHASIVLKDFMNLYDPIWYQLNEKNLEEFVKKYGLPLYTDRRDNRNFLGISLPLQYINEYPKDYYSCLKLDYLEEFYFFIKAIVDIVNLNDDEKDDIKYPILFMKMVYLLKSPFMKPQYDTDVLQNHIEEFNVLLWSQFLIKHKGNKCVDDIFMKVLQMHKKTLEYRIKEYRKFGNKLYYRTQKFELYERPKNFLEFLNMVEKSIVLNKDESYFFQNGKNKLEEYEVIKRVHSLFVSDYLSFLIRDFDQMVIKDSKHYHLTTDINTFGAIIFGLIYTLDSKRYLRKCPQCGNYFYPCLTHPNQRCCNHTCSDLYRKALKRRNKINHQTNQIYLK